MPSVSGSQLALRGVCRTCGAQQVYQRRQDVRLHHTLDLLLGASSDVRDRPAGLLYARWMMHVVRTGSEVCKKLRQHLRVWILQLVAAWPSCSNLLDALLLAGGEQVQQAAQRPAVDDDLRLQVVARHDVAHRAQRRHQHGRRLVPAGSNAPNSAFSGHPWPTMREWAWLAQV
jgi:hypothetical protein